MADANPLGLARVERMKMNTEVTEEAAIIAAAQGGDMAAFETLVRRHTPAVYAHALRFFHDDAAAQDVVQEVFVKVYKTLASFDGRSRFTTWLFRVTRNTCLDEVRAGKRRPQPVDPFDAPGTAPDFSDAVALSTALEAAMARLPQEDRDSLSAIALFGLSYPEAAEALGVPVGTVKSRVFRARRALALELRPQGGA